MIWIISAFVFTKEIDLKNKIESPVFWLFLKISNFDLGPLKSKFFKYEKTLNLPTTKISKISLKNCNFGGPMATFFGTPCKKLALLSFHDYV